MHPTDSELEVLNILWTNGPSSVRYVNEHLNQKRDVGYTTTLKIMQIMHEKGLLTRDVSSKTHIYKASIKESYTKQNLLRSFVQNTFNGSMKAMVVEALGEGTSSKEELDEIKELIKQIQSKEK
ncbi:MAG TPA: BlaI/MecI/CopY family transcriptional regulator [Saprospiraceae bacterium]|nr:BlaI/MecI/CopY family transcriptional regulator [Saprospiraceae bacterium]